MSRGPRLLACLLAAWAHVPTHAATTWTVDPAHSELTFHPTLAGGEFAGRFEQFDATIVFDPRDLGASSLRVVVDLLAAHTGEADRDAALQSDDFFRTARWPRASFSSTSIRPLGGDRFEATGKLTLRDVTRDVRLALRFVPPAGAGSARLTGSTIVKRLDYGIGQGEWRATDWLADPVRVEFALTLRAPR